MLVAAYFLRRYFKARKLPSLALMLVSLNIAAFAFVGSSDVVLVGVKFAASFTGLFFLLTALRVEAAEARKQK